MSVATDPNDKHRLPNRPPVYACDFDDTVAEWDCGPPIADEIAVLWQLADEGWHLLLHTARTSSQWEEPRRSTKVGEMLEYLVRHDVPFDQVWGLDIAWQTGPKPEGEAWNWLSLEEGNGYDWLGWRFNGDTGKPVADIYRDDRGDGRCACHQDAWVKCEVTARIVKRARQLAGIEAPTGSE